MGERPEHDFGAKLAAFVTLAYRTSLASTSLERVTKESFPEAWQRVFVKPLCWTAHLPRELASDITAPDRRGVAKVYCAALSSCPRLLLPCPHPASVVHSRAALLANGCVRFRVVHLDEEGFDEQLRSAKLEHQ